MHVSVAISSKSEIVFAIWVILIAYSFAEFLLIYFLTNDAPFDILSPTIGIRDNKVSTDADKIESVLISNLPLAI